MEAKNNVKYGIGLKKLSPKQILQRLPIALEQVKPGNTGILCIEQKKLLKKYIMI